MEKNASNEENEKNPINYIPKEKRGNLPVDNMLDSELMEKMKKINENLENFKKKATEKFNFIEAIGIIPKQASKIIEEEYSISEEETKKDLTHILIIIPEEKFKNIQKIKSELIKIIKEIDNKFWLHVLTPVDLWNLCLDSKYEIIEAFGMSFPILDKGILGAMRVTQVHKTLVLKKFEKYVTSYVFFGSLVRGEAKTTSDVDIGIIIDDTDVKRMPIIELKEKLRAIIYQYIQEAVAISNVKNNLNVQVWLLTEFWEGVKDANPIFFTFIRDGIPLYDRGTFLPWKSLLRRGKIKPTPEALDMFMASGDRLEEMVNRRILDIAIIDIYWGVITPTQGILMLYGLAPPNVYETVKLFKEIIVEKEKLAEKKYGDILEEILIKYYKGYEHGKIKKITGKELDELFEKAKDYLKRLKELREQIETQIKKKSIEETYENVFSLLKNNLKTESEEETVNHFKKEFIDSGKMPKRLLDNLNFIIKTKKDIFSGKKKKAKKDLLTGKEINEVEQARKCGHEFVNSFIEYLQRKDFLTLEKNRFFIKGKKTEILFLKDVFIIEDGKIFVLKNGDFVETNYESLNEQITNNKKEKFSISLEVLEALKKRFGNFEIEYQLT